MWIALRIIGVVLLVIGIAAWRRSVSRSTPDRAWKPVGLRLTHATPMTAAQRGRQRDAERAKARKVTAIDSRRRA